MDTLICNYKHIYFYLEKYSFINELGLVVRSGARSKGVPHSVVRMHAMTKLDSNLRKMNYNFKKLQNIAQCFGF